MSIVIDICLDVTVPVGDLFDGRGDVEAELEGARPEGSARLTIAPEEACLET